MAYAVFVHEPTTDPVTWRRLFKTKPLAYRSAPVLDAHLASLRDATTELENVVGLIVARLRISDAHAGIMAQDDRQVHGG